MEYSPEKLAELNTRLLLSRARVLTRHSFFGLLLMHMRFGIDPSTPTAYTDGDRIAFGTDFLEKLTDSEVDFVMMHEILHVALLHCTRGIELEPELYNIACDIVVNSNILKACNMDCSAITLKGYGVSMHLTPSGREGFLYTAEEVYAELLKKAKKSSAQPTPGSGSGEGESDGSSSDKAARGRKSKSGGSKSVYGNDGFDEHGKWKKTNSGNRADVWAKRVSDAAKIAQSTGGCGSVPLGVERTLKELSAPILDWRTILAEFVEEETVDFSFSPPDRRFDGSPFFLPDFNDTCDRIENLLFMIDTSGSVSDKDMTRVYSEVSGAIERFDGRLSGLLGFFDTEVYGPFEFDSVEELTKIKPKGGGGTSFHSVFRFIKNRMSEKPPYCVIILTDGQASFPEESAAMGIPVLWIMTGDIEAPFGKCIKLE